VITILEIETGVLLVERRDPSQGAMLRSWLNAHVLPAFSERILSLDTAVAQRCARLHVPNPRSDRDAIIAATALVHGMTVVTRNIDDFEPTGVEILNPWNS
jgi:predicted nucleic acid-binding protein